MEPSAENEEHAASAEARPEADSYPPTSDSLYRFSADGSMLLQIDGHGKTRSIDLPMAAWLLKFVHPDDCDRIRDTFRKAVATGTVYEAEHRALRKDGSWFWVSSRAAPVRNEAGIITEWFGSATDISDRKRAEVALQKNEQRLAAIFTGAAVGLSEISCDGRLQRVNDYLCEMLGRSRDQLLGSSILDITHPEDLPETLRVFGLVLQNGQPASIDKRYIRSDGNVRWANSSLTRLNGESGAPGVLAVTVDLTHRKLAEDALRDSEERFRALAEASPALIWQVNREGAAVYINPRYIEHTGTARENLLGEGWLSSLHPDDAPDYSNALGEAQHNRTSLLQRVRIHNRAHEWRWMESHAEPWYTAAGEYAGHVGMSVDITDLVRAQEELLIGNEQLNLALEASGDGVWDWNLQTDEIQKSARARAIYGLTGAERVQNYDQWVARIHPEDVPSVEEALQACLDGTTPKFSSELRIRNGEGSWTWVQARALVVTRDTTGKPLRLTGTITDITEKRESEEVVWRHANFDILTGLPNRRLFRDRLDQEVKKARRSGLPLALLFIDLDRFKEINDLLGHDVGDLLLREAANRISNCVRGTDTVARLGGDEFTAILPSLDDQSRVEAIASEIVNALAAPFQLGVEVVWLTASVGITMFPADAWNAEDLIRNADQAMYAAKNSGRNQFSYFTRMMRQESHDRLRLISDLRQAVAADQFQVYYQPVVDLRTGLIVKAEALLRWHHPRLGLIEPPLFIPFAEESGLINDIGDWVFRQAAETAQLWRNRFSADFQISVNRSPVQFLAHSGEFDWLGYLERMGLTPECISVEITEGVLLNASAGVVQKLLDYRDAGVQVAIDDFGTGYSSLAYLRKFHIDYLKIDQSFVQDVGIAAGDSAIVRSMVAMAHELGLKVIAEGIETTEQYRLLKEAGCDYAQGFLFSKAIPAADFEARMEQGLH